MSEKKPTAWIVQPRGTECPVCGKRTYSAGGIHPQCAVLQADAARSAKIKEDRKREAKEPKPVAWTKKKCPKCGTESHVRRKMCECGFEF